MNAEELRTVLNHVNAHHGNKFNVGVFAANRLPHNYALPAAFIANTDGDTKPGTHWIAFFVPSRGTMEYFDSYGLPPLVDDHVRFLGTKTTIRNDKTLQDITSTVCGEYCLLYLCTRMNNQPLSKFLKIFRDDPGWNDDVVRQCSEHLFKHFDLRDCHRGQHCRPKCTSF